MNKINIEYKDKIKCGELVLWASGDGSWDYYINKNNIIYSISKDDTGESSYYGNMSHFIKMYINYNIKYVKLTKKAYDVLVSEIKSSFYYKHREKEIIENVIMI